MLATNKSMRTSSAPERLLWLVDFRIEYPLGVFLLESRCVEQSPQRTYEGRSQGQGGPLFHKIVFSLQ